MRLGDSRKGSVHPIILTFLVVAIIIAGSGMFLGSVSESYGINDSKFSGLNASSMKIMNNAQNLENASRDIQENPTTLIGGQGFTAFASVVFGTVEFATELGYYIVDMIGLPLGWLISLLMAMLAVTIAFSVVNWIRGGGAKL